MLLTMEWDKANVLSHFNTLIKTKILRLKLKFKNLWVLGQLISVKKNLTNETRDHISIANTSWST